MEPSVQTQGTQAPDIWAIDPTMGYLTRWHRKARQALFTPMASLTSLALPRAALTGKRVTIKTTEGTLEQEIITDNWLEAATPSKQHEVPWTGRTLFEVHDDYKWRIQHLPVIPSKILAPSNELEDLDDADVLLILWTRRLRRKLQTTPLRSLNPNLDM
eukprot:191155-Amphidinium_carterae.2